jgi:hypothetical protein
MLDLNNLCFYLNFKHYMYLVLNLLVSTAGLRDYSVVLSCLLIPSNTVMYEP